MFWDIVEKVMMILMVIIAGILTLVLVVGLVTSLSRDLTKEELNISNAQPIAQQKIGDDVNPDILIIYEAKVDGETVYPSVIKEVE